MFTMWQWPMPVKIAPIEHDPLGLKVRRASPCLPSCDLLHCCRPALQ